MIYKYYIYPVYEYTKLDQKNFHYYLRRHNAEHRQVFEDGEWKDETIHGIYEKTIVYDFPISCLCRKSQSEYFRIKIWDEIIF